MNPSCTHPLMIKICGLTRPEDGFFCSMVESPLAGFIFHPSSPRCVTPERAADIDTGRAMRVGVFVRQSADEVLRVMELAGLHLAQLHGDQDRAFCNAVGRQRVMRVFWPERYPDAGALERDLEGYAACCRFFLLDAGTASGGHGKTLDVSLLAGLRSPRPWFLAGGLGPDNIMDMVRACDPCGVDLNSGVESAPGVKDHEKIKDALRRLAGAR